MDVADLHGCSGYTWM